MDWLNLSAEQRELLNSIGNGSFEVSNHCLSRMNERAIQFGDIVSAGKTAIEIERQDNQRFKIVGKDRSDLELILIAEVVGDVIIVTVF